MFSNKVTAVVLASILGLAAPAMVVAADGAEDGGQIPGVQFSMDAGVEAWGGDITYQIGYPVRDAYGNSYHGYFPFSELSFPLDAAFGVVSADMVVIDRYEIGLTVKKNVSDPGDDMEDRDWITESDPNRLDIYSDSEVTDFSAFVVDLDVSYRFFSNDHVSFAAGFGYMYQNFEYETAVRRQWSPSGLTGFDYVGDGNPSLIYEVDINMFYLLLEGQFTIIPPLRINASFAYAPAVDIKDTDQHLLRNKVNTGDMSGYGVIFSAEAEYDFTSRFFMTGGVDHTVIEADGDMDASFYGVYNHTVAEEFESTQTSLYAKIGFRFGVN